MPNVANVLKEEIARVARKELRGETESLKKLVASFRHEMAEVKRRMQAMERQLKVTARRTERVVAATTPEPAEDSGRQLRFSATRFAAQRKKLGLSAADFALLLGVSSLSVYKWENGQARPRQKQLEKIAEARKLGKREALSRLEVLRVAEA